ncbi:MAG: methyltransferase domain-containing protein [Lysobacterales bacterium]
MSHAYNAEFMSYADQSSRHAANTIARLIKTELAISSVLDVGCAKGTWLNAWRESGSEDILGLDGDYVRREELVIPEHHFSARDLAQPVDLGRRFDLVQSLEVAEHLPHSAANLFVDNLVRHSAGYILFSAAPPGQGGEFHINEQPYDYWREKFAKHGFRAYDWIRPQIQTMTSISFWYRYNLFLYAHESMTVPPAIAKTAVPLGVSLQDISPASFRLRKAVVRMLPARLRDRLAHFKARYLPSGRW